MLIKPPKDNRPIVLHLITGLGSGGAESMLYKLLSATSRSQFNHCVVSLGNEGFYGPKIAELGISVEALDLRLNLKLPFKLLKLYAIFRNLKPAIIQTWLYHADLLGCIVGKLAGRNIICWNVRNSDVRKGLGLKLIFQCLKILSPLPKVIIFNSIRGKDYHLQAGYQPKSWKVIPNGFDPDKFYFDEQARVDLRRSWQVPENSIVIGMIARFHPDKDFTTFMKAARTVFKERGDVHFVLAGLGTDSLDKELLDQLAEARTKGHVHFLGEIDNVRAVLSAIDICSLSTNSEGFPNVVGEAMACERPVIATDVGDIAMILQDSDSLVPVNRADIFAEKWQLIMSMSFEERRSIGQKNRQLLIEKYSLPVIIEQFEEQYQALLS